MWFLSFCLFVCFWEFVIVVVFVSFEVSYFIFVCPTSVIVQLVPPCSIGRNGVPPKF